MDMPITTKDRGLIAQIAGTIAAGFRPDGRRRDNDMLATDSVELALKVLEKTDLALAKSEGTP